MRTVAAARKIVISHLATLPLSFGPTAQVQRGSKEMVLNWAARIKNEVIPFPDLETITGNGSAIVSIPRMP